MTIEALNRPFRGLWETALDTSSFSTVVDKGSRGF